MNEKRLTPLDWAARHTASFIAENLPEKKGCSVLDVGCGTGRIARALLDKRDDINLVGIDLDDQDLEEARGRGVDARKLDYNNDLLERADVIVFSRSLHHLHPLDEVLARACSLLLTDGGKIIIEEFGYELVDQAAAYWLFSMADLLAGEGDTAERRRHSWIGLKSNAEAHGNQGNHRKHNKHGKCQEDRRDATTGSAQQTFRQHHETHHEISTYSAMLKALSDRCDLTSSECPYLFRYICDMLADDQLAQAIHVEAMERGLAQAGAFGLCGRRLIARPKN